MLADRPTNLQIGLAADVAGITKVGRPQLHVLKYIECIVRALTPEPDPTEVSAHVQRMEPKLRLNSEQNEQICRPDQCELRTEISSSRKHRVECSQCIRLASACRPKRTRRIGPGSVQPIFPPAPHARIERFPKEPHWNPVSTL